MASAIISIKAEVANINFLPLFVTSVLAFLPSPRIVRGIAQGAPHVPPIPPEHPMQQFAVGGIFPASFRDRVLCVHKHTHGTYTHTHTYNMQVNDLLHSRQAWDRTSTQTLDSIQLNNI